MEITEDVEIWLEHEAHYDWVAFVPQRESDAGALTKYFGKVAGSCLVCSIVPDSEGLKPGFCC
ncbi:DNA polymerase I [Natrinema gari JCM 14663]|uniref:DNA polymerase I n=1 Tax=Natrinema gari JCM 14663 TaxID=1230459 RepID=L9ZCU4_9EURY|nr:DNA polymerase I [Natrinema gari JCM 14663]